MPRMPDANDPYDPAGALFEQLRPRLTAISRRIVGSDADAEDVVQDCFLKWQGAGQGALQSPAAWLTTVVQHGSIDVLRRRARESAAFDMAAFDHGLQTVLALDTPPALPEDGLLRRADLAEALACMLSCLSPSERLALVLREVFECEHADIAAVLGTRPVNARQHLARAQAPARGRAGGCAAKRKAVPRTGAPLPGGDQRHGRRGRGDAAGRRAAGIGAGRRAPAGTGVRERWRVCAAADRLAIHILQDSQERTPIDPAPNTID